jgi:hypothetical protein
MKFGSSDINNIMLGDQAVTKIYLGSEVAWEKAPEQCDDLLHDYMTGPDTPSTSEATAASEFNGANYKAWHAFSEPSQPGDESCWSVATESELGWVQIDWMGKQTTPQYYQLTVRRSVDNEHKYEKMCKSWEIIALNEDDDEIIIDVVTDAPEWTEGEMREYQINPDNVPEGNYHAFRLNVTDKYEPVYEDNYLNIGRFHMFGCDHTKRATITKKKDK